MPWYKFYADHGGGHQSHTEEYRYFPSRIRRQDKEDLWRDWADGKRFGGDSAIGDIKMVRKLPENVLKAKLESARANVVHWQAMVKILEGMQ